MNKLDRHKDGNRLIPLKEISKPLIGRFKKVNGKEVFIEKK